MIYSRVVRQPLPANKDMVETDGQMYRQTENHQVIAVTLRLRFAARVNELGQNTQL